MSDETAQLVDFGLAALALALSFSVLVSFNGRTAFERLRIAREFARHRRTHDERRLGTSGNGQDDDPECAKRSLSEIEKASRDALGSS